MTGKDARPPAAPPPRGPERPPADSRAERLAAALRANLHRRKAQGRARAAGAEPAAAAPGLDFAPKPGDKDGEAGPERR